MTSYSILIETTCIRLSCTVFDYSAKVKVGGPKLTDLPSVTLSQTVDLEKFLHSTSNLGRCCQQLTEDRRLFISFSILSIARSGRDAARRACQSAAAETCSCMTASLLNYVLWNSVHNFYATVKKFLARDVIYIYISRLCYDVSARLSVRLSVTEVHWRYSYM